MEHEKWQYALDELAKSQALDESVKSVAEQLDAGIPKHDIINGLSDAGLDPLEAEQFVNHINNLRLEERRKAGTKDLGWGFLLLLGAAAITFGTWAAAGAGGSYWVMWGAMAFGAFYILRALYRKITGTTSPGGRLGWVLGGIILVGGLAGGGIAIGGIMNPPELTAPSDSFIVWEDDTVWEDEIQGIVSVTGIITNTHSQWSITKVKIELEALDDANNVIKTYDISVIPSTIPPGAKGMYSKTLQVPYFCVSITPVMVWEWLPP